MTDLVDLGASGLDEETNTVWVQCKGPPVSDEEAPDFGKTLFMQCLGVASRPYGADDSGNAQGVIADVPGFNGVCIGAHDARAAKVFQKLGVGETAVFATGKDFESQVLLKELLLALIVKDDMVFAMDRKKNQMAWACGGYAGKVSEEDGWLFLDKTGTAGIQIKDGSVFIFGQVVLGGRTPLMPVAQQALPAGATSTPAVGVFIGE